ncbi:MAG: hypothetical protein A2W23_04520 [Planctomycetes bacterium RBG_16_43_13]|nr:MAG: hypothetical protein A2W23_04520 [Planctomycetes bacterium RBG_16_43_13]
MAIKPHITCNPTDAPIYQDHGNAGEGLFWITKFIEENEGTFYIHSGKAKLYIEQRKTTEEKAPLWQGTVVVFQINLERIISIVDIFNKYAPPQGDFDIIFDKNKR